jgi:hypothetical protein
VICRALERNEFPGEGLKAWASQRDNAQTQLEVRLVRRVIIAPLLPGVEVLRPLRRHMNVNLRSNRDLAGLPLWGGEQEPGSRKRVTSLTRASVSKRNRHGYSQPAWGIGIRTPVRQ